MLKKRTTLMMLLTFAILISCTNTSFDSQKWKNWNGKESFVRWDMADDLIDRHDLKGKTREEIEELLGKPGNGINSDSNHYYYDLGPCRRGIDFGSLYLDFKDDKVVQVEKHCN